MKIVTRYVLVLAVLAVAACARPEATGDIHDPLETTNRSIHAFNKGIDRAVLSQAAEGYRVLPKGLRSGLGNMAENLSVPATVVNDLMQFRLADAIHNSLRFTINSTIGLAGFFDLAEAADIEARPSDFGETLHVWGVGEGAYLELPLFGPSTARDATGMVVDWALDPMGQILTGDQEWLRFAGFITSRLNDRSEYAGTVESILYESEDSYAQARLIYLESRRHSLGIAAGAEEELYDLYDLGFE